MTMINKQARKLLFSTVLAIASFPGFAHATDANGELCEKDEECAAQCMKKAKTEQEKADCRAIAIVEDDSGEGVNGPYPPRARVTVAPPYQGPPPIGWVYAPYTQCGDPPRCSMGVV